MVDVRIRWLVAVSCKTLRIISSRWKMVTLQEIASAMSAWLLHSFCYGNNTFS